MKLFIFKYSKDHQVSFLIFVIFFISPCLVFPIHPRMFFYKEDIPRLRTYVSSTHKNICKYILLEAENIKKIPIPLYNGNPRNSIFEQSGKDLIILAFTYIITGNPEYFTLARNRLLKFAEWPFWGADRKEGDRDLDLACMLMGYSLAFDWIYNDLTEQERIKSHTALLHHTQEMFEAAKQPYNPEWRNGWVNNYANNHHTINNSALGLAALVLEEEDPHASEKLDYIIGTFIKKNRYILEGIKDGSWAEGHQYQNGMLIPMLVPLYYNLKRLKDTTICPNEYFKNFAYWSLYNYLPGTLEAVMTYSDYKPQARGMNSGARHTLLRLIAAQYNNGYAEWLAQQIERIGRTSYEAWLYVFEFFYYNPSIKALPPTDLAQSRRFPDLEGVIWRTGWDSDALIFGLKTGPYKCGRFIYDSFINYKWPWNSKEKGSAFGHGHCDANTFYIYKGSIDLSSELPDNYVEQGHVRYHNTLIIDKEDQYKPKYGGPFKQTDGRLETVLETPGFNFLIANATNRYREKRKDRFESPGNWKLKEYKRYVLFVKPYYIIMIDDIYADKKHTYDWICHFSGQITIENDWVKGITENTQDILGVKIVSPQDFSYTTGIHSPQWYKINKSFISIRSSQEVANTQFVMVFYPTTTLLWSQKPVITSLGNNANSIGISLTFNDTQDHLINYHPAQGDISVGEYVFRGDVASIIKERSGTLKRIFIGNGSYIADNNGKRILISSNNHNMTLDAVYSDSLLTVHIDSLNTSLYCKIFQGEITPKLVMINKEKVLHKTQNGYVILGGNQ